MFEIQMLTGPLVGAVIGYFTNYIAVKMLFRPLRPVKIGKFTLPFTPGIIPKGRERLAKAIGMTVGTKLLSEESIREVLLSESMKNKIIESTEELLERHEKNNKTLGDISNSIGDGIARQILKAISEAVKGSVLAMLVHDSVLENFKDPIAKKINGMTVGTLVAMLQESDLDIKKVVLEAYEDLIENKLSLLLVQLNIEQIVQEKINQMEVLELEELLLSIMKKELNAIVSLGALIGLVIGAVNIFI